VKKWKKNDMSISKYKNAHIMLCKHTSKYTRQNFGGFFNLESSLKFKMLLGEGEVCSCTKMRI
jgi:hypothetical protein